MSPDVIMFESCSVFGLLCWWVS